MRIKIQIPWEETIPSSLGKPEWHLVIAERRPSGVWSFFKRNLRDQRPYSIPTNKLVVRAEAEKRIQYFLCSGIDHRSTNIFYQEANRKFLDCRTHGPISMIWPIQRRQGASFHKAYAKRMHNVRNRFTSRLGQDSTVVMRPESDMGSLGDVPTEEMGASGT